jgi:hypothetical protein
MDRPPSASLIERRDNSAPKATIAGRSASVASRYAIIMSRSSGRMIWQRAIKSNSASIEFHHPEGGLALHLQRLSKMLILRNDELPKRL